VYTAFHSESGTQSLSNAGNSTAGADYAHAAFIGCHSYTQMGKTSQPFHYRGVFKLDPFNKRCGGYNKMAQSIRVIYRQVQAESALFSTGLQ
jgi:hypothetical protein